MAQAQHPDSKVSSDAACLDRFLKTGSNEAFGEIVARYQGLVYARCISVLGNPHEAEDATQATFLVFFKKVRSLARRGNLAGWFYHTAEFTAYNHQKLRSRRSRHEQEASAMKTFSEKPEIDLDREQIRKVIYATLDKLPEATRDALVRHFLLGLSLADVSVETGMPARTVSARVSGGLEKIRRILECRGWSLSTAALAGLMAPTTGLAVPAHLTAAIHSACFGGGASATASTLAQGTLRMLTFAKIKAAAAVLAIAAVGTTAAVVMAPKETEKPETSKAQALDQNPVIETKPDGMPSWRRVHVYVNGHVMGVGFRDFTQGKAKGAGVFGWVRNLSGGRVEALIEGPTDKVNQLLEAIRQGPSGARVDNVEITEETYRAEFNKFTITY